MDLCHNRYGKIYEYMVKCQINLIFTLFLMFLMFMSLYVKIKQGQTP